MSRKLQRSGVAFITVVALALVLAAPAHAAGLSDWGKVPTVFHQAWQWIAKVLPGSAQPTIHRTQTLQEKSGLGVDPNGLTTAPPAGGGDHTGNTGVGDPNG